jgi:polysaccharide biosynthesis protein PslG
LRAAPLFAAMLAVMLCVGAGLGIARAEAAPAKFFGVMPQGPLEALDYQRMGEANVGVLRFELRWAAIDPSSADHDYDWSTADEVVGSAARNGFATLPFVASAPNWVLELDGHRCEPGKCQPYGPRSAAALRAFRAFLTAAAERYGPGGGFWNEHPELVSHPIGDWQIWNEQNSPTFWKPKPNVKAYAKLLHAANDAITRADPRAEIVLGGMFGTPLGGRRPALSAWDFLAKLYRQPGVKRDFDAVAPHPYASKFSKVLDQLGYLRDVMRKAHDRTASLWITELGWASGGPPNPLNRGLQGQAARLTEAYRYLIRKRRKLRIEGLTWYSWRDNSATDVGLCEWCPESGLLTEEREEKPSYRAFTRLSRGG